MRILPSPLFSLVIGLGVMASAEEPCGSARVTGGRTCTTLQLSFDLKSCDDEARLPAKITCGAGAADAVLKTEKATYHTLLRELTPGVWSTVGRLRRYSRDWQLPSLPVPVRPEKLKSLQKTSPSESMTAMARASSFFALNGYLRTRWYRTFVTQEENGILLAASPAFTIRPDTEVSFQFEPLLATDFGKASRPSLSVNGAYADWRPNETFGLRFGRQALQMSNGWILGRSDWENAPRYFDAIRGQVDTSATNAGLFYARTENFRTPTRYLHLIGFESRHELGPSLEFSPFGLYLQRADHPDWDQTTIGLGVTSRPAPWHLALQGAYQTGTESAYALDGEISLDLSASFFSRVSAQGFYASRDFDFMLSAPHQFLGITDAIGRRNTTGFGFAVEKSVSNAVLSLSGFWFLRTDTARSAFLEDSVTKLGSEYGSLDRFVGTELDASLSQRFGSVEWRLESSVFFPGRYLTSQGEDRRRYRIEASFRADF